MKPFSVFLVFTLYAGFSFSVCCMLELVGRSTAHACMYVCMYALTCMNTPHNACMNAEQG
jgi:hypothetical protein